jgi:hypothetical protein
MPRDQQRAWAARGAGGAAPAVAPQGGSEGLPHSRSAQHQRAPPGGCGEGSPRPEPHPWLPKVNIHASRVGACSARSARRHATTGAARRTSRYAEQLSPSAREVPVDFTEDALPIQGAGRGRAPGYRQPVATPRCWPPAWPWLRGARLPLSMRPRWLPPARSHVCPPTASSAPPLTPPPRLRASGLQPALCPCLSASRSARPSPHLAPSLQACSR